VLASHEIGASRHAFLFKSALDCDLLGRDVASVHARPAKSMEDQVKALYDNAVSGNVDAFEHLRQAATQGNPYAENAVGMIYLKGNESVPQDAVQAVTWLRMAAEQGMYDAAYQVGELYCQGIGVYQDYTEAVKWMRQAAEEGKLPAAQKRLAEMYRGGLGVPANAAEAEKWKKAGWSK
jgi:TPR repeat protein